ncbi:response regulator [Anaerobacillus isosaccharinicus]|uniref:DNA-binding response regulator n=1 Tax=Anaerobacillus isosaccharinicus TaxID=1532552 RepID=A0A1S2M581_9BACI|nr:response regulator transcription factor [Anaerobacillus isosaccharinicus]MBA5585078.1 response regulator transcription factor [Anaerobacillus isosaccharinicus]QOY36577.1 response regulator transcription factor [Anaerobacillus isosaccharinicus]
MQPFRVLIVDDHIHAREAIREIVGSYENFLIVGEATNGKEALTLTEQLMPDLILMDIHMPEMDGLSATKIIKTKYPYVKVIIITVSDEVTNLFEAIKKGAQGYLLKNINPDAWYEYLQAIADDEVPMSEELAFKLLQEFTSQKEKQTNTNPLSKREQEVLELVAKGNTNKQISIELTISEYTVKNHLKNIMHKLHLENRVQITRYAYENGWVE